MIKDNTLSPNLYTEINQLQNLKTAAKADDPEALRQVAQQFEQLFVNMLLKSMRQATSSMSQDNVFNGKNVQFFQGMLDNQLAMEVSNEKGLGLTAVVMQQLTRNPQDNLREVALSPLNPPSKAFSMDQKPIAFSQPVELAPGERLMPLEHGFTTKPRSISGNMVPDKAAPIERMGFRDSEFDSPQNFVRSLLPMAKETAQQLGVDPKVLVAQAALETGWGKHIIRRTDGESTHNLFNIKAHRGWSGEQVKINTLEYEDGIAKQERAPFRSYDSFASSFKDYADFLKSNGRYSQALQQTHNPEKFLDSLQQANYATDPQYAEKIKNIYHGDTLAQFMQ